MTITASNAAKQTFIPLARALARAYQAFASYDAAGYQNSDLTVSQADVLFTLGNTAGLTFTEIGDLTLITKGTLTGVVDRMSSKGLVKRLAITSDRRYTKVVLTTKGNKLFAIEFPRQIEYLKKRFDKIDDNTRQQAITILNKLVDSFD